MRSQRAILVGPAQQENLALAYLSAAAQRAGHQAQIVSYAERGQLDEAVCAALERQPDLIGVSIAFQSYLEDYMRLIRELRVRGFAGHLTAGGHVPTFCYGELLRDLPELDTVVRHDGEETLVEMLDCLGRRAPVRALSGLVWRQGDATEQGPVRTANGDLDALAWPVRERTPTVAGVAAAFVLTARGCVGHCSYCSIAAYTSEQHRRYRLRRPQAVADEIASLYHDRSARVFAVEDDLFVLPSESRAIERVSELSTALRERGVRDASLWVKGSPETITPAVCQALRELGVIHLFLGIESASAERLDYLGRRQAPEHNRNAIRYCREQGIVTSFNCMLFDPDCSLEDISETLDFAETQIDRPWNICRTEVYSGTTLRQRLEREGRLDGDYRGYGYRMRDDRAEVTFRILRVSLHERAFAMDSLLNRLISLSFAGQVQARYLPGSDSAALSRAIQQLGIQARRDTLGALRDTLAFVKAENIRDAAKVRAFALGQALAINARDRERRRHAAELSRHLELRGTRFAAHVSGI